MASKYECDESDSQSATDSDVEFGVLSKFHSLTRKQRTTPKSLNRNALMARENRRKKKLYIENLERELTKERKKCKHYATLLKDQAAIMDKQDREIKYMKGILANNGELCALLRGIHSSTGLPVGTSLNKNFTISNAAPADVIVKAVHPWSDDAQLSFGDDAFLDASPLSPSLDDHNYTHSADGAKEEGFGVCLHIANHKLSLEYCAQCHENSTQLWNGELR